MIHTKFSVPPGIATLGVITPPAKSNITLPHHLHQPEDLVGVQPKIDAHISMYL
jgi:hypothetical protein